MTIKYTVKNKIGDKKLDEDKLELIERRLTEKVRSSVEKDLRIKYLWLGLLSAVFTSGAITLIVNNLFTESKVQLRAAVTMQDLTTDRLTKAVDETTKLASRAKKLETELNKSVESLNRQLVQISRKAESLLEKTSSTSTGSLRITESLRQDLDRLSKIVQQQALSQTGPAKASSATRLSLSELQKSLTQSENELKTAKIKADLTKYPVNIAGTTNGMNLLPILRSEGFLVSTSADPNHTDENSIGIRLSTKINSATAYQLIKSSMKNWRALKYVYFGDHPDTSFDDTYIGTRVIRTGKLSTLSIEDVEGLLKPSLSIAEFRRILRSYNIKK